MLRIFGKVFWNALSEYGTSKGTADSTAHRQIRRILDKLPIAYTHARVGFVKNACDLP